MSNHYDIQILRSKLIAMTRLTQRTVDYSIKAFQLGRPDLCRVVQNSKEEMAAIRGWIANHGREFLATRIPAGADFRFACAALRISTALEVACYAAFNIARHSAIRHAEGWTPVSAELEEAGNFVYRLLHLCILSLLKGDVRHAKAVLQSGSDRQGFDLAVYLAHHDLAQRVSSHARFETALVRCLDGIAGQVREIADALLQWHGETVPGNLADDAAPNQTAAFASEAGTVPAIETNTPCTALGFQRANPPRPADRLNPSGDVFIPWRGHADGAATEEFAQARLMGLQQRVCELLVKNQQLRMALIAERADSQHDQLC